MCVCVCVYCTYTHITRTPEDNGPSSSLEYFRIHLLDYTIIYFRFYVTSSPTPSQFPGVFEGKFEGKTTRCRTFDMGKIVTRTRNTSGMREGQTVKYYFLRYTVTYIENKFLYKFKNFG